MSAVTASVRKLFTSLKNTSVVMKVAVGGAVIVTTMVGSAAVLAANKPGQEQIVQNATTAQVKSASTIGKQASSIGTSANTASTVPTSTPAAPPTTIPTLPAQPQVAKPAPVSKSTAPISKPPAVPSNCPECGGEPAKTPTHVGALIFSSMAITIPAGGLTDASLNVRSDSDEAITIPYTAVSANFSLPMISASSRPVGAPQETYRTLQTFSFNASPGTALGTYSYKLVASGNKGGSYSGYVTVTIVAP